MTNVKAQIPNEKPDEKSSYPTPAYVVADSRQGEGETSDAFGFDLTPGFSYLSLIFRTTQIAYLPA
jgi:hypothetical protein